jgi:hypothetical protein
MAKYILHFDPYNIVIAEERIFMAMENETRSAFPHFYFVHTLLIYLLALYGGVIFFQRYFKILIPPFQRFLSFSWRYRVKLGFFFLYFFLATLLVVSVYVVEYHLKKQGYYRGSFYRWVDFSQVKPDINKVVIADDKGMTVYAFDSFPRKGFPLNFMVNKEGFPNPFNFDKRTVDSLSGSGTNKKKKRLVLGDSFVEGLGASNFNKCFMEVYRKKNPDQVICSAGIRGSDPVQYRLFAEELVPKIAPDEISVMFCGWNDVMTEDRKPEPYIPLFTDIPGVGCLFNYLPRGLAGGDTVALPPDRAYRVYRKKYSLEENKDLLSVLCRQSCIATRLYSMMKPNVMTGKETAMDSGATYRNLKQIKSIADSAGVKFSIVFIPTPDMEHYGDKEYEEHFKWVFKDMWQYVTFPPTGMITMRDCCSSIDYHFNDAGQLKFAGFLQKVWAK